MTLKNSKIIKKNKSRNKVMLKKNDEINTARVEDDLIDNPFMLKEEIKPFTLNTDCEKGTKELEKDEFKELLKRRIKQMNKIKQKNKENVESNPTYEEDIEESGKNWFEDKLSNGVTRKLTII